jgi:hypothetical protein
MEEKDDCNEDGDAGGKALELFVPLLGVCIEEMDEFKVDFFLLLTGVWIEDIDEFSVDDADGTFDLEGLDFLPGVVGDFDSLAPFFVDFSFIFFLDGVGVATMDGVVFVSDGSEEGSTSGVSGTTGWASGSVLSSKFFFLPGMIFLLSLLLLNMFHLLPPVFSFSPVWVGGATVTICGLTHSPIMVQLDGMSPSLVLGG